MSQSTSPTRSKAERQQQSLEGIEIVRIGSSAAVDAYCRLLSDHGAAVSVLAGVNSASDLCLKAFGNTDAPFPPLTGEQKSSIAAATIIVSDDCCGVLPSPQSAPSYSQCSLRDALARYNPHVIHCTFSGTGSQGGSVAPPTDDTVAAAQIGLNIRGGLPVRAEPIPVASTYAALVGAVYSVSGLLRDARSCLFIDVPLAAAASTVLGRELIRLDNPEYVDIATLPHLPNIEIYRCSDGRYIQPHGLYWNFVKVLCEVGGHPEWTQSAIEALTQLPNEDDVKMWRDRLAGMFASRPAHEWEADINQAGGACTMVRDHDEWRQEAHPYEAEILRRSAEPGESALSDALCGPAVRVESHSAEEDPSNRFTRATPTHATGGPNSTKLTLPLSGVRVIDFCIVLAGPTCGRVLADLGADVIKVDDPIRHVSPYPWFDVNRGKRSAVIDLRTTKGKELAIRLAESADVVVQNFRQGKMDELGLGADTMLSSRPGLIYASLNAFDYDGPWEDRAGWEHNAQAATGMQIARQRDDSPEQVPYPVNDYATGLLGALGILMALRTRSKSGAGSHVRGSLARSATFLQRSHLEEKNGSAGETYFPHKVEDGLIWVASDRELEELIPGDFPGDANGTDLPATAVVRALLRAGVPAVAEADPNSSSYRSWMTRIGSLRRWEHPRVGWIEQVAPQPRTSVPMDRWGWPAPERGDDTAAILREMGISSEEINELMRKQVTFGSLPFFE